MTFIQSESNKVDKILGLGGAFFVPGNWTPVAEANIFGDPQAAKVVASHGEQITFVPLNISNKAVISNELIIQIACQKRSPFTEILSPIMSYYSKQYETIIPDIEGAPLHDVILFSFLISPEYYKTIERQVVVTTYGSSKGLTYAFRPSIEYIQDCPIHLIVLDFNRDAFIKDFIEVMS